MKKATKGGKKPPSGKVPNERPDIPTGAKPSPQFGKFVGEGMKGGGAVKAKGCK
jgi:hypothetical protein